MIREGSNYRVSASDLVDTIACPHRSRLNRAAACNEPIVKNPDDEFSSLFAEHGKAHEKRVLDTYKALYEVLEFDLDQVRNSSGGYAEATRQTLDAMKRGVPVIYQAVLLHDGFLGLVDFLVARQDISGKLLRDDSGRYIYEPIDAKLARRERVSALVQLGGYAAVLEDMGCATPIEVHIKLGNGNTFSARAETLMPVARQMRSRLQEILSEPESVPVPSWAVACPACEKCKWSKHCEDGREKARDLTLVYGMRADTRKKLVGAGISKIEDLATKTLPVGSGINSETFLRLQAQAKLQIKAKKLESGIIAEFVSKKGFNLLPLSDIGDIWFDMESDILFDLGVGLEYMFGVSSNDKPGFFTFEAHDRVAERKAFEDFVDYVQKRLDKYPAMHVYHYANYEVAAMKRLAQRHGTRETVVDQFLRGHVFVDLYQVVRYSIRTSARSLGLKDIENLYMNRGATTAGQVATAVDSMVEYEKYVGLVENGKQTEAQSVLANIRTYNQFDCESTRGLDAWLRDFAKQSVIEQAMIDEADGSEQATKSEKAIKREKLLEEINVAAETIKKLSEDPKYSEVKDALLLLSSALRYHIRETRAKWWPHFDRCKADIFDLADDSEVVVIQSCKASNWGKIGRQKNLRRTLSISASNCNPQDVFEDGDEVFLIFDNPPPNSKAQTSGLRWYTSGTVEIADDGSFSVVEKSLTDSSDSQHSDIPVAVLPGRPIGAEDIEKQLLSLGNDVLERANSGSQLCDDSAWCDLLLKRIPRQQIDGLPHSDDPIKDVVKALRDSKNSYVAVQGPPGSGKTYLGAHVIAQLAKLGWKIGVVAQSHKTVENLLRNLVDFEVPIGKKNKEGDVTNHSWTVKDLYKFMADQSSGFVVGGTAWIFAATFRENGPQLDLLVIDEAGQFSLAHTISAGSLAKRVLLLGDPQQLAQVSQAAHEAPIDNSALSHLLDGRATISDELGYFLEITHRMHPAVTRVISRLQYERRLKSHPRTAERLLEGINPGIHLVQVDHYDCTTSSLEEATKVAEIVKDLLGRDWHDFDSDGTPTQKQIDQTNILVVAAYNSQVRLIRRVLAEAGLDEVQVGTVDKFQGAEQPVVIASLAASSFENLPRGLEFLISPNRINVALSRARWASYLVFSGELRGASPVSVSSLLNFGSFLGVLEEAQR